MFPPIYGLTLAPMAGGDLTPIDAKGIPGAGYGGWYGSPLGSNYIDAFHKSYQLAPHRLIQELVGIAYACADLNASTVASTRLGLYVRTDKANGDSKCRWKTRALSPVQKAWLRRWKAQANNTTAIIGEDSDVEEITDRNHPLLKLLHHPEPIEDDLGLSSYDHRYMTQLYMESLGRAYWYIGERDAMGHPRYLRLLRSHLVREVPDQAGDRVLSHYEYGGVSGERYMPDEVIKFHFPDPYHPHLNGYGPLMAGLEKIRIGRKEDAHINALLDNMGRPDAVWSPKGDSEGGGIGTAEAGRVRSAFKNAFAMAGRGGLLVSEVPGNLEILGWKPQDIVELERAKAIKTDICNVFGVPDAKLERNAANLASAKTADEAHAKDTVYPRCVRSAETLNNRLVPLYDDGDGRLFLAYDSPIPDDEVFQLEITRTGGQLGVATIDESRTSLGLAPIGGEIGECRTISKDLLLLKPDGTLLQSALPPTPASTTPGKPSVDATPKAELAMKRVRELKEAGSL